MTKSITKNTRTNLRTYLSNLAVIKHTTPAKWSLSTGHDRSYASSAISNFSNNPSKHNTAKLHKVAKGLGASIKNLKSVIKGNRKLLWNSSLKAAKARKCNYVYALYLMHPEISTSKIANYLNVKYSAVQHYFYVNTINTPDLEKLATLFHANRSKLIDKMQGSHPLHKINKALLKLRLDHHLSEPELAKKFHVAQTTISGYETIRSFNGGYKPLFQYARVFKTSWFKLLKQTKRFSKLEKNSPAYLLLDDEMHNGKVSLTAGARQSILRLQEASDCWSHFMIYLHLMDVWAEDFTPRKAMNKKKSLAIKHLKPFLRGRRKNGFSYKFRFAYACGEFSISELANTLNMSEQNVRNYLENPDRLQLTTRDSIKGAITRIKAQHKGKL